jgi:hypothetical protein
MRALCVVSISLALATLGLAGCAVETAEPEESTATAEEALLVRDTPPADLVAHHVGIGGRSGVTFAGGYEHRMYDFSSVPRVTQRAPYEANLTVFKNALVFPHTGTMPEGREITLRPGTDCGVTCTVP